MSEFLIDPVQPAAPSTAPRPIALLTGGSRGLGRAAALALAAAGWDLLITWHRDRDAARAVLAEAAAAGARAAALQLDVGLADSRAAFAPAVERALAAHFDGAPLDALVHNAGFGVHAAYAQTTEAQFDALMDAHVKAPFFLTQALLPRLRDGASVLNVSSGLARFSLPGYAAYAMAKGAVEVMTRYQARELGARGIRVNTLAPGAIETDFGGGAVRDNAELNGWVAQQTALGRVGLPQDIGAAVVALLSPGLHWVNGQRVEASGGMFL
ncbi:SDR family NAD(P)-dependent oxidoreductase [Pseudaquabacterium rugosum]|jgi:NAD(P)-dependent dehydrogenase (short-subunit alcohol dehydrogenase family)|uniref:SDR family oxidoreductase n=1 Tax=Pseudaquabacterium rugosum TaxID=2984194 RepID=A0ABU9BDH4_9BURK